MITYTFLKDFWPVLEWQSTLKSDGYRADVMQEGRFSIFRITKEDVDLQEFYIARRWYVRRTLLKKTIMSICATLLGVYTLKVGSFFSVIAFVGGLLALLSYLVGFYLTSQKFYL